MSSRNRYLSASDRPRAARIHASLRAIQALFATGEHAAETLAHTGTALLTEDTALTLDYLALVDPADFTPVTSATSGTAVIVAARLTGTRLLDNIILIDV